MPKFTDNLGQELKPGDFIVSAASGRAHFARIRRIGSKNHPLVILLSSFHCWYAYDNDKTVVRHRVWKSVVYAKWYFIPGGEARRINCVKISPEAIPELVMKYLDEVTYDCGPSTPTG